MNLQGKQCKVTYSCGEEEKFIKGEIVGEDEKFITVKGSRDGTNFTIAKNVISEIRELNNHQGGKGYD